jgi:hypothetical protein
MTKSGTSFSCSSRCAYFHPIKYGHDKKSYASRPTTNVPVICLLCHPPELRKRGKNPIPGIPKYLFERHVRSLHPAHARPGHPSGRPIPQELAACLVLEPKELERVFGADVAAKLPPSLSWMAPILVDGMIAFETV